MKIKRLLINIYTLDGDYILDETFSDKLNIIASQKSNARGKSILLEAIYYALGFEIILGTKNKDAMRSVFWGQLLVGSSLDKDKKDIEKHVVSYSKITLWIENRYGDVISIDRTINCDQRDDRLMMVNENDIYSSYFVHDPGAAIREDGFHLYLENFLDLDLPEVLKYDGTYTKLYIELLLSSSFVEQKFGWSDYLANTPMKFQIREPKRRLMEYLLDLDVTEQEQNRIRLKELISRSKNNYKRVYDKIQIISLRRSIHISKLTDAPLGTKESDFNIGSITVLVDAEHQLIQDYIDKLDKKISKIYDKGLETIRLTASDLSKRLAFLESSLYRTNQMGKELKVNKDFQYSKISNLKEAQNELIREINHINDTIKLKEYGSIEDLSNLVSCPICGNETSSVLLTNSLGVSALPLEDNKKYLVEKKKLIEYEIAFSTDLLSDTEGRYNSVVQIERETENQIRTLKEDLTSANDQLSKAEFKNVVRLENRLEELKADIEIINLHLLDLNRIHNEYVDLLRKLKKIPSDNLSFSDREKINRFSELFRSFIDKFNYDSLSDHSIEISKYNYTPLMGDVDMKFNSSASDNIRAIQAYNIALLILSNEKNLNHLGILSFDEPKQHNMKLEDYHIMLKECAELSKNNQIFIAMTVENDAELKLFEDYENHLIYINEEDRLIKERA